jgi:hypothetical protein
LTLLLLDADHRLFTTRHLIVGMGRATHHSLVRIATWEQERALLARAASADIEERVDLTGRDEGLSSDGSVA